ncbi:ATP-dependent DNA helicase RecG [Haliangium sp.]|uniref:ATP-dependent DNA helicase RecG n=1 Tax=Haliangium sp. TaxID=2663208 RepID=UPI003D0B8C52
MSPAARTALIHAPTTLLPGIGPRLAERLSARGLHTVEDLIWLVPRRYDDARQVAPLGQAIARAKAEEDADPHARTTTFGVVVSSRFHRRGRRRWIDARLAGTDDTAARLIVRWFGAHPGLAARLARGTRVVVSGRLERRTVGAEMANPDILSITGAGTGTGAAGGGDVAAGAGIIPRYSDVAGIAAGTLRKAVAAAVSRAVADVPDGVPAALAQRMGLVPLAEALRCLHDPPSDLAPEAVEALNRGESDWHRRLAFDELFVLGLAVARRRRARRADRADPCPPADELERDLARALPWQLTGAQRRAVAAISADLASDQPMNRLLQGDVGSGKTAVAFAAALQAARAGKQVAFMAPTAILAEQHAATLLPWCTAVDLRATLLTASTPRKQRDELLGLLGAGRLDLLIGTHALLSEGVDFADLGLVIIDEQHRFGVAQRFDLRAKGEGPGQAPGAPHLLVMTATPIPRTLALTAYGDLDVTVIDELPPGRQPPKTMVLSGASGRERAHTLVRRRLDAGERAYVVCPLIEPSENTDGPSRADAEGTAERLAQTFAPARVGLVHGRMKQAERDPVMDRFRAGELDILVATTVIEVGVDVPEATVMVILDAHGFGLAQLHQLRGRVGRGGGESYCLLMTRGRTTPEGRRRLEIMAETCDGFRIAEEDLRLRGPGELIGVRQSGLPTLRFGDLREHGALLVQARDAAEAVLADDPLLARPEHAVTRAVLERRTRDASLYGPESG